MEKPTFKGFDFIEEKFIEGSPDEMLRMSMWAIFVNQRAMAEKYGKDAYISLMTRLNSVIACMMAGTLSIADSESTLQDFKDVAEGAKAMFNQFMELLLEGATLKKGKSDVTNH